VQNSPQDKETVALGTPEPATRRSFFGIRRYPRASDGTSSWTATSLARGRFTATFSRMPSPTTGCSAWWRRSSSRN